MGRPLQMSPIFTSAILCEMDLAGQDFEAESKATYAQSMITSTEKVASSPVKLVLCGASYVCRTI